MKIALSALLCLFALGRGGSSVPVADAHFGASETPLPVPLAVEFRTDGTCTQVFAGSQEVVWSSGR